MIACIDRGISYDKLGGYNDAIADFNRALVLNPTNLSSYYCRAASYESIQLYEKAVDDYNCALNLEKGTDDVATQDSSSENQADP